MIIHTSSAPVPEQRKLNRGLAQACNCFVRALGIAARRMIVFTATLEIISVKILGVLQHCYLCHEYTARVNTIRTKSPAYP